FMFFYIKKYSRQSLMEIGETVPWTGGPNLISLPLSENLTDTLEAKWDKQPIPYAVAKGAEAIMGLGAKRALDGSLTTEDVKNAFKPSGEALQGAGLQTGLALGGGVGNSISALAGVAPNSFLTILFIGPEYKRYQFQWNFSPRSREESE